MRLKCILSLKDLVLIRKSAIVYYNQTTIELPQPMFLIGSTEPCKFWSWRNMCILGVCTPTLIVAPGGSDF